MNVSLHLLNAAMLINEYRQNLSVVRAREILGTLDGKRIAVWGLAFKPGTDDVRDAPSLAVIGACLAEGASVIAYDPLVHVLPEPFSSVRIGQSALSVLEGADALIVMTDWPEFSAMDMKDVHAVLPAAAIIDLRGVLRRE